MEDNSNHGFISPGTIHLKVCQLPYKDDIGLTNFFANEKKNLCRKVKRGGCEEPCVVANLANDIWRPRHTLIGLKLVSFDLFSSLVFEIAQHFHFLQSSDPFLAIYTEKHVTVIKVDTCQSSFCASNAI